ncbi:MAG TPA: hypothetical protein VJ840_08400 [Gemmatimonadaceae bacterium]|nr:hypothetical protein [Gemmatimonadaceae bacterium]
MKSSWAVLLFVLVSAVAVPVAAQVVSGAAPPPPATGAAPVVLVDGKSIGPAEPWGARPVGKYDLTIQTPDGTLKGQLTLADSAGKLASSVVAEGQGTMHFESTINGSELTLVMKRDRGPITVHVFRRGDRVSGTWTADDDSGTFEGVGAATASAATTAVASGPADAWSSNAVGKYRITLTMPNHDLSADVTVREEAGKLIANIWPVGDNDGRDFGAALLGNQLVISGTTERGALNLTLEHRGSHITGTWQLGEGKGPLAGEVSK